MENTAQQVNSEVATSTDCTLSKEMIAEMIAREKYIEQHPDEWISAEESIKRLRDRHATI